MTYCSPCYRKMIWKYDYEEYCPKMVEAEYKYQFSPMCKDCFNDLVVSTIEAICKTKFGDIEKYRI